jgi:hypothetical protein
VIFLLVIIVVSIQIARYLSTGQKLQLKFYVLIETQIYLLTQYTAGELIHRLI